MNAKPFLLTLGGLSSLALLYFLALKSLRQTTFGRYYSLGSNSGYYIELNADGTFEQNNHGEIHLGRWRRIKDTSYELTGLFDYEDETNKVWTEYAYVENNELIFVRGLDDYNFGKRFPDTLFD